MQTRGLLILDSPIGLVACLPVGMAQVSSVVITSEAGDALRRGNEMGYFQFRGSHFVLVFEHAAQIEMYLQPEEHILQEQAIGCGRLLD